MCAPWRAARWQIRARGPYRRSDPVGHFQRRARLARSQNYIVTALEKIAPQSDTSCHRLVEALKDEHASIRLLTAHALGKMGFESSASDRAMPRSLDGSRCQSSRCSRWRRSRASRALPLPNPDSRGTRLKVRGPAFLFANRSRCS